MRREYEITQEELNGLYEASKPTRYMVVGGMVPRSPQENANDAWKALGVKHGFDYMSVRPITGREERFFTAEPARRGRDEGTV